MKYERIRYRPEGPAGPVHRARSVILRDPRDVQFLGEPAVTGLQVNLDGDHNNRRHIIGAALIEQRQPLEMCRYYGHLMPPDEAAANRRRFENSP